MAILVSCVALGLGVLAGAPPVAAAPASIIVWASPTSAPVLKGILGSTYQGLQVEVVTKDLATVTTDLQAATELTAPDVVEVYNADIGGLAESRLIAPAQLPAAATKAFPANLTAGFRWGGATWGVPVMYETVALVTNATLVPKQPKDFAELSARSLAVARKDSTVLPFAISQSPSGDAISTYPLFSGLGGYIFAVAPDGTVDPNDVGLAAPELIGNARLIDTWNSTGLIRSAASADTARAAFVTGKSPFWLAPISELPQVMTLTFPYRITSLPSILPGRPAVPLLKVRGFAATTASTSRGHAAVVTRILGRLLVRVGNQAKLAAAANLPPASTAAAAIAPTTAIGQRIAAFGKSSALGVAMPNVPQTTAALGPLGQAWLQSTSGPGAVRAAKAFRAAQRAVLAATRG